VEGPSVKNKGIGAGSIWSDVEKRA
jgi:hypothetical protein